MIDIAYKTASGGYSLGGLINGVVDGIIVTRGDSSDIWELFFERCYNISLSKRYSLLTDDHSEVKTVNVASLRVGDRVVRSDASSAKLLEIKQRTGKEIILPKRLLNLNNFLVIFNG